MAAIPAIGLFPARDAEAQGAPPSIGMVIYGNAPAGSVDGQLVTAVVVGATKNTTCGTGQVINDGGLKFVVRVRPASAATGCGAPGTSVRLVFGATPTSGPRATTTSVAWSIGPKEFTNVNLGNQMTVRGRIPNVASDGVAN